jgi:hypothetical protein
MPRVIRPVVPAIALAACTLLGLTACGGSSSSAPPPKKTLAKADFITQGDAICKELDTKLQGLTPPTNDNDGKAIAAYLRQGAQLSEDSVNRIDGLGRPDADAPLIDTIVAEQRDTVTKARQAADAFDKGDIPGGNTQLQGIDGTSNKTSADSKQFGFTVCGQNN